jgi:Zn-dependent protease/CBS domain-containing protein
MDLTSGFTIGRIRGIEIRVHWSWTLIFFLISWSLAGFLFPSWFPDWTPGELWTAAVITALFFFVSVLLHELSHAFVALGYGMRVPSITLFVFGGVSSIASEMETAGQEFRVAIAGPLMSWAVAAVFAVIWWVLRPAEVGTIAGYLAFINVLLGAFNLLPGFPLDGGRVFRSFLWARTKSLVKATRIASQVGSWIAWGLIGIGIFWVLFLGLGGLWYVLIGLFLKSASEGAYQQMVVERALEDVRASDVMREPPPPVEEDWTLERIVDERILPRAERALFVTRDGRVTGLITTSDLARVPRERWRETSAAEAMVRAADVVVVAPDATVLDAMKLMQEHDVHQVPVLDDGRLVGLLTRSDVLRQLELRAMFVPELARDGRKP